MNQLAKIIKINLLSLIALPLLVLATISKLISKSLEKIFLILGLGIFSIVLVLVFDFLKDPMEALGMALIILLDLIVIGLILSIIVGIASILSGVAYFIIKFLTQMFDWIYSKLYLLYSSLMNTCEDDYEELILGNSSIFYRFACIMNSIMIGLNRGLILLVNYAMVLSGVLSVAFIVLFLRKMSASVEATMGISLLQLLKLYRPIDQVFIGVVSIVVIGSVVGILFLIGLEWREWGEEMMLLSSHDSTYMDDINQEKEETFQKEIHHSNEDVEYSKGLEYFKTLERHVDGFEGFMKEIQDTVSTTSNMLLKSNYNEYATLIQELFQLVSSYRKEIPLDEILKLTTKIDKIDSLKNDILELIGMEKKHENAFFFTGCTTKEKLEKRYKSLCKTYHPDMEFGDEETFKKMSDEYEKLVKNFEG